ncbi:MAG: FAD-dependent thymidylate synthase [Elainellaceae cyanobacterium]
MGGSPPSSAVYLWPPTCWKDDDIVWSLRKLEEGERNRLSRNTNGKHVIASSHNDEQVGWNEKSFRYVAIEDGQEFYCPLSFRQQAKVNKQATEGPLDPAANQQAVDTYAKLCQQSYDAYRTLLDLGVGREQARGVLVPAVYTSWVWTVSLQALLHFLQLRLGKGAQNEITAYAQAIHDLVSPIVPYSIAAWDKSQSID